MAASAIPLRELARLIALESHRVYPLKEVADMTGFSQRWIERECRADRLKHTHEGHTRGMTLAQVELLVASRERGATATTSSKDDELAQARQQSRSAATRQRPRRIG